MNPSCRKSMVRVAAIGAPLALALVALLVPASALAQGGSGVQPGQPAPGQPTDPNIYWGGKFFDDAIKYVARGQNAMPTVRDFYAKLDAKLDLDDMHHEGLMRLWFMAPNQYRQELTTNNATTTKILAADRGWMKLPTGRVQNLLLSAEGQQTIKQLKEDRSRIADLTKFLTLQALKGPDVRFVFEGYTEGSGTYAGKWIKVSRRAPGRAKITFWLAYQRGPNNAVTATWPGIVRVAGEPARNIPTEDYILREWDSARGSQTRQFRYPRKIEAYSILKGADGRMVPSRFLHAIVDDIKINAGVDASRFQQPASRPR